MELDVSALHEHRARHLEMPISVTLEPVESDGEVIAFPAPFVGTAQAFRTEDGIAIRFQLEGEAALQCSRCLGSFRHPIHVDITEEFRPGRGGVPGELEDDAETGATFVRYQGDRIDVGEVLRQHILLEVPMKPLCREDCQGLCPTCGQNRNEDRCRCAESAGGDARFGVLRHLLDRPQPDRP